MSSSGRCDRVAAKAMRRRRPSGSSPTRRSRDEVTSASVAGASATPKDRATNERFSPTVRSSYSPRPWGMYPTRRRISRLGASPKSDASPEVGRRTPRAIRIRVVLPAPLAPMRPTTSPGLTSRSTSSRAASCPNRWPMPRTASSGSGAGPAARAGPAPDPLAPVPLDRLPAAPAPAPRRRGRPRGPARPAWHRPAPSCLPRSTSASSSRAATSGRRAGSRRSRCLPASPPLCPRVRRRRGPGLGQQPGPVRHARPRRRRRWRRPRAVPPAAISAINSHSSTRLSGSMPVVGSSRTSSAGLWSRAIATASFWRMPPKSSRQPALAPSSPIRRRVASIFSSSASSWSPYARRRS